MKTRFIDGEEVSAIAAHLSREEWLPLWVALESGLRVGDVVALTNANLNGETLTFTASKTRKAGTAKLSPTLARELSKRRGFLFPSPRDSTKHITRQAIWHRVKRAAKRAGIPSDGVAPHSFRKFFAVEVYRKDGIGAAQEALQHERACTTELYALSDWLAHGEEPLKRSDIIRLVEIVCDMVLSALRKPLAPTKRRRSAHA